MEMSGSKSPRGLIESQIDWEKTYSRAQTRFCQVRPVRFPKFLMFLPGIRSQDPFHGNQRVEISSASYRDPDWLGNFNFRAGLG